MLSVIWLATIIVSLVYGLVNDVVEINDVILNVSYNSLDTFFEISCGIILWSGVLEVAKSTGFLKTCTKGINTVIKRLFKTKNKDTLSLISANFICNFLGLGALATPFAIDAINELKKEGKSDDLNILLILNFVAISILPIGIISLRNSFNSINPLISIPFSLGLGILLTIFGIIIIKVHKWVT